MLSAQKPVELPLWPDGAPNTNGLTGNQEDLEGGRVANVVNPSITVYRPAKPNGMAVIMCPGGGYGAVDTPDRTLSQERVLSPHPSRLRRATFPGGEGFLPGG